jgi:hypothetical protein
MKSIPIELDYDKKYKCKKCDKTMSLYCNNDCGTMGCYKCKCEYFVMNGILHEGHNSSCGIWSEEDIGDDIDL